MGLLPQSPGRDRLELEKVPNRVLKCMQISMSADENRGEIKYPLHSPEEAYINLRSN